MDQGKNKLITKKIKVYGIVQGVGFRPLVYRIAKELGINGTVRNVGGYVEITAQASEELLCLFIQKLKYTKVCGCEIVKMDAEDITAAEYENFVIIRSGNSDDISIIPPDLPVCEQCLKELDTKSDRRYQNPFISCISCGPRYTIIDEVPYDRDHTTMKEFDMCESCKTEYTSPDSRRYHAQTISCNDCGPYLIFRDMRSDSCKEKHNSDSSILKCDKKKLPNKTPGEIRADDKQIIDEDRNDRINKVRIEQDFIDKELIEKGLVDKERIVKELIEKDRIEKELIEQDALEEAVSIINSGGIIAVKGIGGYHFVCSPFLEETVQRLRKLKGREEKPFAVMFESTKQIEEYCLVSGEEKILLETKARPIVLLYSRGKIMAPSTNKESVYCGTFLPYTPLQMILTRRCGPLIMTSANQSDTPVIKEDEKILSIESPYLDGVLYHHRKIIRSVDDSVAKIIDDKPQLIRRSRGYVPYPVFLTPPERDLHKYKLEAKTEQSPEHPVIFCAGGDLKAAFCLYHSGNAIVSQYFGDLEEVSVMQEFKNSYEDLSRLYRLEPELAVCDLHPNYYSSAFAKSLGIPVIKVQHHHAHIASVMAEHDLKDRVIGIAFDGTGYGTDGNIWGGEFLICEGAEFIRAAHLSYTPILGGDKSMRDAKKTASCYLLNAGLDDYILDDRIHLIKSALINRVNTVLTSSMGRLFDAVAAILGLRQENRYEGECAAALEREAVLAKRNGIKPEKLSFSLMDKNEVIEVNPKPVLEVLCALRGTKETGALALGFHFAIAEAICYVCESLRSKYMTNTTVMSGGVFQNTILTEQTLMLLRQKGFEVYLNISVPPNDGSISLGQSYIALQKASQK